MKLHDIEKAITLIENKKTDDLRTLTYLATYPEFLYTGNSTDINIKVLRMLATRAYAWMPRILRLDGNFTEAAVKGLEYGHKLKPKGLKDVKIDNENDPLFVTVKSIKDCVHSVVGASKILHFLNKDVFPIWDSKIHSKFYNEGGVNTIKIYLKYMTEVHRIREEGDFKCFFNKFSKNYSSYLKKNGIKQYAISKVRAIEAAAYEVAPEKNVEFPPDKIEEVKKVNLELTG
jgi:hypothetical protein